MNICMLCWDEHLNHDTIYLRYNLFNKKELEDKLLEIKQSVDKFNNNKNKINENLNNVKENINIYYKIIKNAINNYDIKKEIMNYYSI